MARAVEGMVVEQKQVVVAFCVTVLFITFNMIGVFFIMMTTEGAATCTVILLVSMGIWYSYSLRIYNRFKFERETEDMRFDENSGQTLEYRLKPKTDIITDPTLKSSDSARYDLQP